MRELHRLMFTFVLITAVLSTAYSLSSHKSKYQIFYHGLNHLFENVKSSYSEHEIVKLYSSFLDKNPEVIFCLNDGQIPVSHDNKGSYLKFVMPNHDCTLRLASNDSTEQTILLANYYETSISDEDITSYELVVLASSSVDDLILEVYSKTMDEKTMTRYFINEESLKHCIEACKEAHAETWSKRDDIVSIDGKRCIFKYYDHGELIRITTDEMTENGMKLFDQIRNILCQSINDEQIIK